MVRLRVEAARVVVVLAAGLAGASLLADLLAALDLAGLAASAGLADAVVLAVSLMSVAGAG